jgi:hypothetical protein
MYRRTIMTDNPDLWGNEYGSPMYWIPPDDDEYWIVRKDKPEDWDEDKYWENRIKKEKK